MMQWSGLGNANYVSSHHHHTPIVYPILSEARDEMLNLKLLLSLDAEYSDRSDTLGEHDYHILST